MFFSWMMVKADNDKPIEMNQLPVKAQTFITTYFKDQKVALITQETGLFYKSYDVVFASGEKLEFDKSGPAAILRPNIHQNNVRTNPANAVPGDHIVVLSAKEP